MEQTSRTPYAAIKGFNRPGAGGQIVGDITLRVVCQEER